MTDEFAMDEQLDDLTVYRRLILLTEELNTLSKSCCSLAAATALLVAAWKMRQLASALWQIASKES